MKDRKKTVIPKKKAIRKPKYVKYFAIWLAIFLAVSMTASYFIIGVCRQQAKTKAVSRWNEYTQQLTRLMNDYCAADEDDRDVYFIRVRDFIFSYGEQMNEYCSVYVDNEKILETPRGSFAVAVVEFSSYNEETDEDEDREEVFYLKDQSYLEPLIKSGKYDFEKDAYLSDVYSVESEAAKSFASFARFQPVFDTFKLQSIYVNEDTHTYLPGVIEVVIGYDEDKQVDITKAIDCTPKDTKGYRLINFADDGVRLVTCYDGCINPALTDFSEAESISNDPSDDFFDDTASVFSWECLTATAEAYSNKACFKAIPATKALVLTIACIVSLLLAITVSSVQYSGKKAVWEIFEYRKKTTAAMAHDLKTPLAAMSAYAENLEYVEDPDKRAYYSSKVRENVAFMNKTIESILMFTKSEAGSAKSAVTDIDVRALIDDEYNAVAELFKKKNITVDIKGEGHVKSNKELIEQAVRNLIGNATKYARPDTTLDIAIDGKGFKMTNLTDQKITNVKDLKKPFVKGEESRDAEGGAGLGLSIVENCLASAGHSLDIGFEDETFTAVVRW